MSPTACSPLCGPRWRWRAPTSPSPGPVRNQAVVFRIRGRRSAMRVDEEVRGQLAIRFEVLLPHLNERQQRLALACEAQLLGHGGVSAAAAAARVSPTTVRRGVSELDSDEEPLPVGRVRRAGGGRTPVTAHDPELMAALLGLVEPNARGDPMSPLRWTTKSLRHLATELTGLLTDPKVTGMPRTDLAALTERVVPILAARNERHRHRRRGEDAAARGGVFTQKLTDAQRVLAAVIYQRGLCSHETLAELLQVSRRTLGTAAREVAVVLEQVGHLPVAAQQRFATAAALLASAAVPEPATDTPTT